MLDAPAAQQGDATVDNRKVLAWTIFGIGMLFYCYAYFLRISPSVMMDDLLQHFHINASLFGNFAAFYYYSYTPMQLPVGVLIDRYNIRLVLFSACLLAVSGLAIFISVDNYYLALLGRFLIGFGSAFAYISALKLATLWLPPNRFAMAAGLTTSFGMLAAIFSERYLQNMVQALGYQHALYSALIAGVVLSVVIFFLVKERQGQAKPKATDDHPHMRQLFSNLAMMIRNPQMWLIGVLGCLLYLPASVFLDVWGVPYLEHVLHLTPKEAVNAVNLVFFGWIVSSPVVGSWSDHINSRRMPLLLSVMVAAAATLGIFYWPGLSLAMIYLLMFILGLSCGAHPLCFSLSKETYSKKYTGTSTALTNTLIMLGGVIFQPLVGILLDWHSKGYLVHGVPTYSASDYQFALSILPIALVASIAITLFIKDTRCQQPE